MKLGIILAAALLAAAPLAANAQGLGGGHAAAVGHAGRGAVLHSGTNLTFTSHPGNHRLAGFRGRRFGRGERFNPFLFGWWGAPWGFAPNCAYADACGEDAAYDGPTDERDYLDDPRAPPPGRCGAWVMRGGRYVWSPGNCAADAEDSASLSDNECSDWVWRASLHRSVCRWTARGSG
jgi:hypothetical protein